MFYLIRHGKTDYSQRGQKIYQGFGTNLAPLAPQGIEQIKATARDGRLRGADLILSSPYTRALQTAAILSKELGAEIVVETGLHEWLANKNYLYETQGRAEAAYQEFVSCGGVYPAGRQRDWEDAALLRSRLLEVLRRYRRYNKVLVACHGMLIHAVSPGRWAENGEIVEFRLEE